MKELYEVDSLGVQAPRLQPLFGNPFDWKKTKKKKNEEKKRNNFIKPSQIILIISNHLQTSTNLHIKVQ